MANLRISELITATEVAGTEYAEIIQNGINKKALTSLFGITREFNRAFSSALVFDKNEIEYASYVMTDDIDFTISSSLTNQYSSILVTITADGTHAINFGPGFTFLYGIANGQILDVGTYEIYFLNSNGNVRVNVPGVSAESSSGSVLITPASFAADAGAGDPETEIDLTWADVSNESSYLIEVSETGIGGWSTLNAPAANATSYTHTGLTVGETRYYRLKAVGDGVTFFDSPYTEVISGQTQSGSDLTDPTFVFDPVSGVVTWTVNKPIIITANEPIRHLNGDPIVSNDASIIILKQTNSGGADIAHSWTIDGTKQIITITPTTQYGENQLVYWAINNVEDVNGNDITVVTGAQQSSFTTTEFTFFDGSSNRLIFGDILDSLFASNDTNFWLELTLNNPSLTGTRLFAGKSDQGSNQRGFKWFHTNTDIFFVWYAQGSSVGSLRVIKWTGALTSGEHIYVLKYDGSIDTNDGLDRLTLLIDGGTAGSKTVSTTSGTIGNIFSNTAQLSIGVAVSSAGTPVVGEGYLSGEAKDFIVRSAAGATVEINVPNLKTGLDTSGNARHGTWA
jgi:hypothetical protein